MASQRSQPPSTDLVTLPVSGEIIDLNDRTEVGRALASVKEWQSELREVRGVLDDAVVALSRLSGSKTLHVEGVGKLEVKGGWETVYHAEEIERELLEAGMPEDRVSEIIVTTITKTVKAVEAKKAASANPVYAAIIERHMLRTPKRPSVSGP